MSILDDFDVVEVPRTFSIAEVRVLKNKISFNVSAASELGYPPLSGCLLVMIKRRLRSNLAIRQPQTR